MGLPGSELVMGGVRDLREGRETISAAAVAMAAPRLRELGLQIPPGATDQSSVPAAHLLYRLLAAEDDRDAHARFNAISRRVLSFARCAEHA